MKNKKVVAVVLSASTVVTGCTGMTVGLNATVAPVKQYETKTVAAEGWVSKETWNMVTGTLTKVKEAVKGAVGMETKPAATEEEVQGS